MGAASGAAAPGLQVCVEGALDCRSWCRALALADQAGGRWEGTSLQARLPHQALARHLVSQERRFSAGEAEGSQESPGVDGNMEVQGRAWPSPGSSGLREPLARGRAGWARLVVCCQNHQAEIQAKPCAD